MIAGIVDHLLVPTDPGALSEAPRLGRLARGVRRAMWLMLRDRYLEDALPFHRRRNRGAPQGRAA
jgi:hypothetical protein